MTRGIAGRRRKELRSRNGKADDVTRACGWSSGPVSIVIRSFWARADAPSSA